MACYNSLNLNIFTIYLHYLQFCSTCVTQYILAFNPVRESYHKMVFLCPASSKGSREGVILLLLNLTIDWRSRKGEIAGRWAFSRQGVRLTLFPLGRCPLGRQSADYRPNMQFYRPSKLYWSNNCFRNEIDHRKANHERVCKRQSLLFVENRIAQLRNVCKRSETCAKGSCVIFKQMYVISVIRKPTEFRDGEVTKCKHWNEMEWRKESIPWIIRIAEQTRGILTTE